MPTLTPHSRTQKHGDFRVTTLASATHSNFNAAVYVPDDRAEHNDVSLHNVTAVRKSYDGSLADGTTFVVLQVTDEAGIRTDVTLFGVTAADLIAALQG